MPPPVRSDATQAFGSPAVLGFRGGGAVAETRRPVALRPWVSPGVPFRGWPNGTRRDPDLSPPLRAGSVSTVSYAPAGREPSYRARVVSAVVVYEFSRPSS